MEYWLIPSSVINHGQLGNPTKWRCSLPGLSRAMATSFVGHGNGEFTSLQKKNHLNLVGNWVIPHENIQTYNIHIPHLVPEERGIQSNNPGKTAFSTPGPLAKPISDPGYPHPCGSESSRKMAIFQVFSGHVFFSAVNSSCCRIRI